MGRGPLKHEPSELSSECIQLRRRAGIEHLPQYGHSSTISIGVLMLHESTQRRRGRRYLPDALHQEHALRGLRSRTNRKEKDQQ